MKTTLLFLFAGLLTLQAQTWAPIGATWHYRSLWTVMGVITDGSTEIKSTSTVNVDGKVCSKLTSTFRGASWIGYPNVPPPAVAVTPGAEYITYMESDVIYLHNGTSFDTIVNLKAIPGDTWKVPDHFGSCDSVTPMLVTDTGHISLNGMNLRQVGLTYSIKYHFSNGMIPFTYTFTERVGDLDGFLFRRIRCVTDDPGDPRFSCYSDNNFPVVKRAGVTDCDVTTVGILKHDTAPVLSLYPNPSNGVITVQTSIPVSVQIMDHLGRILYSNDHVPPGLHNIDTDLPKGIYFLVASSNNQKQMIRFARE